MHICSKGNQGHLLKTRVVVTLGPPRGGERDGKSDEMFDPHGNPVNEPLDCGQLIEWLIREGTDVIRLNMSFAPLGHPYGSNEKKILDWMNAHKNDLAKHVAVLGDLPGPKIRLRVNGPQDLGIGDTFLLDFTGEERPARGERGAVVMVNNRPFGDIARVDGSSIGEFVRKESRLGREVVFFVGDGKVVMRGEGERDGVVTCRVLKAGVITENQGLTIKHAGVEVPAFMEQDREALEFLLGNGADVVAFIGVSFVRVKNDILLVKKFVEDYLTKLGRPHPARSAPAIIAKIETLEACQNIDEILDVADGVMVARGDLGLQLTPPEVPALQKEIIRKCNLRGKPCIIATQMLDSMETNIEPTRAESTDVFNAIADGADAVMLSGETSKGRYPAQAVRMMVQIAESAEEYYFKGPYQRRFMDVMETSEQSNEAIIERLGEAMKDAAIAAQNFRLPEHVREAKAWERDFYQKKLFRATGQRTTDRISESACILSEAEDYKAIVAPTTSGRTARMISRFRPLVPILGVAHDPANARKLMLSFGVYPLCIGETQSSVEEVFRDACNEAKKRGYIFWSPDFRLLHDEDEVISTSGTPLLIPGTTNLIQIRKV